MENETRKLLTKKEKNQVTISELEDENYYLNRNMCKIEGKCPHCHNAHYPHCLSDAYSTWRNKILRKGTQ